MNRAIDIVSSGLSGGAVMPFLVEVKLLGDVTTSFRRVRETLERIGISSRKQKNTLWQSCHILHREGHYYITHFKELFLLDGRENELTVNDIARQNAIISLLSQWKMIEVLKPEMVTDPIANMNEIKVLKHDEREKWNIIAKYKLGRGRTEHLATA